MKCDLDPTPSVKILINSTTVPISLIRDTILLSEIKTFYAIKSYRWQMLFPKSEPFFSDFNDPKKANISHQNLVINPSWIVPGVSYHFKFTVEVAEADKSG